MLIADMLPPVRFASLVPTPAIDALLTRAGAHAQAREGATLEAAVLRSFGTNSQAYAAITAAADLGATSIGNVWLRADPVHFAVSRDNVQLFDSHVLSPTTDEMAAIAETINKHFSADGLHVAFPDPARGYLSVRSDNLPTSTPLWDMPGANVFDNLPRSDTKTNWRAITNEVQMLLHDHPVNAAREARGAPTINGLWFWGGGQAPTIAPRYQTMLGRLVLARGLAGLSNCNVIPLPDQFAVDTCAGNTLVLVHQATREVRAQKLDTWEREVAHIDANFVAPALAAFDEGKIASLNVIIANEAATLEVACRRDNPVRAVLRRFRSKRALADFARTA